MRRSLPSLALLAALLAVGVVSAPRSANERAPAPIVASSPAASASPAAAFTPSPSHEAAFVSRINNYRASRGLRTLTVHSELVGVARNWTEKMVSRGQISHNPNLANEVSANWRKLGENVGVGYDVQGLWQAFLNSPSHHANVVDPEWTHVGVGVVFAPDDRLFTTHNFMALAGGSPPPTAPPPTSPPPTSPPPNGGTTPTTGSNGSNGSGGTTSTTAPPPEPIPLADAERVAAVLTALRPLAG